MFTYIHIPFCDSKCKYCRFSSFSKISEKKIEFYVQFLLKSIHDYQWKIESLDSIYFWGWTPSSIPQSYIKEIVTTLKEKFWLKDTCEITLETTPQNISIENIKLWKEIWVKRISMWVQTLWEETLKEIGRENKEVIFSSLSLLNDAAFESISVDFIIGLPYRKKGDVKKDIETVLSKYHSINHISVYMLEDYYYGNVWKDLILKEEDFLSEYIEVRDFLKEKWFLAYELSNFSKPGHECLHNKAYWNHSDVIAFWLWAHGYVEWERYAYPDSFLEYYKGEKLFSENITENDKNIEKIMFGLRSSGIDASLFHLLDMKKIEAYIDLGYLEKKWENIMLGEKGITLLDYILKEILL